MSNRIRQAVLLLVLLLLFTGSLGFAWVIVQQRNTGSATRARNLMKYPDNFRPLDLSHIALPVHPAAAMAEELPDGSVRYLFYFRRPTSGTLSQASVELFEQFNRAAPQMQSVVGMAGQDALELANVGGDGFVVQRSVLVQSTLFAMVMKGNSELSPADVAAFNQFCDSVAVRRAP